MVSAIHWSDVCMLGTGTCNMHTSIHTYTIFTIVDRCVHVRYWYVRHATLHNTHREVAL